MSKSVELHTEASKDFIEAVLLQKARNDINRPTSMIRYRKNVTVRQRETDISTSVEYSKTLFVSLYKAFRCDS